MVVVVVIGTAVCVSALFAVISDGCASGRADKGGSIPWHWTPDSRVENMLYIAGVDAEDVVFDLGCGDGRFVVAAARRGAEAVGYELVTPPCRITGLSQYHWHVAHVD